MFYKRYQPRDDLKHIVNSYYLWEGTVKGEKLRIETPPNGYLAFVFNTGTPYTAVHDNEEEILPPNFLAGLFTHRYELVLSGTIRIGGIVFQPMALGLIYGWDMTKFVNQRFELQPLVETNLDFFLERMRQSETRKKKVALLESLVEDILGKHSMPEDVTVDIVQEIIQSNGHVNLKELAKKHPIGLRQIEKKFKRLVGISPKAYANLMRIGHLCWLMINEKEIDWHEYIYKGGFYDQAHFIKEFLKFVGDSPKKYYSQNHELRKMLENY